MGKHNEEPEFDWDANRAWFFIFMALIPLGVLVAVGRFEWDPAANPGLGCAGGALGFSQNGIFLNWKPKARPLATLSMALMLAYAGHQVWVVQDWPDLRVGGYLAVFCGAFVLGYLVELAIVGLTHEEHEYFEQVQANKADK